MIYQEQNSQNIKEQIKKIKIALLPVGAIEAHGEHLPLGTDNILAEKISEKVSLNLECIILPTINYGQVWSLEDFPGSISISNETLKNTIFEIGAGIQKNGFTVLAIINAHLGNEYAIKEAQRKLFLYFPNFKTFNFFYPGTKDIISKVIESPKRHNKFFHADEIETSYMLYLGDEYVNMDKAINSSIRYPDEVDFTPIKWSDFSNTPIMGNALLATKEKGEIIIQESIKNIVQILKNYV